MVVFKIVEESHGWSIRMDERMTCPFWSRALAIQEANRLAEAIRRHGAPAMVVLEAEATSAVGEAVRPSADGAAGPGRSVFPPGLMQAW